GRSVAQDPSRPLGERANAAADRVDDMRLDALDGRGVDVLEAQLGGVACEPFGKRADRRLGIALRLRDARDERERGRTGAETQELPSWNCHGVVSRAHVIGHAGTRRGARDYIVCIVVALTCSEITACMSVSIGSFSTCKTSNGWRRSTATCSALR